MLKENIVKAILFLCALSSIGIVFFIIFYLVMLGYPQIINWFFYGFRGELPFMVNTLYIGVGGTLLGAVIGIPCAVYLAEFADTRIRNAIKPTLEVLNGFPSVVIGMVGYSLICFAISRYLGNSVTAFYSILAGWIVLGVMSLPLIASVGEDSLRAVPQDLREASLGLGATKWQTTVNVLMPNATSGILTSLLLALGNAMGETVAVMFVIGLLSPPVITADPLSKSNVITAQIANGFGEVTYGSPGFNVLFADAFILFVMTALLNIAIRVVISRRNKTTTVSKVDKP